MSVGLLLVTHGRIGHLLLETISEMLNGLPLSTDVLEVRRVQATDALLSQGRRAIERLDEGQGVLMLTDLCGATPSNIAVQLCERANTALVAGVNLSMLLRIFNYPERSLLDLARLALDGGQKGVLMPCSSRSI